MANIPATCALVLWDERLALTDREPNTGATLTSDYTETGRRPGLPVRAGRLLAQVSGDQDATVVVEVSQNNPGLPGRQGVRTLASVDNGVSFLGHQRETEIQYWGRHPDGAGTASRAWNTVAAAVTANGVPVVAYGCEDDSIVSYWDGSQWVNSTGTDVNSEDHAEYGVALCVDPVSSILIMVRLDNTDTLRTYWSEDDGASFELVSIVTGAISGTAGYRMSAAANRGGIVVMVQTGGTSGDVTQIASSDLGVTWDAVDTATAAGLGWSLTVVDESFYCFSFNPTTSEIQLTRTSGPYESIPDAPISTITTRSGLVAVSGWSDVSGTLYCLIVDNGIAAGDGPDGCLVPLVSYDGGVTFEEVQSSWASDATNAGPRNMVGVHTPYGALVACNGVSPADPIHDASAFYMWLGGWSSVEWNTNANDGTFRQRVGQPYGVLWLPFSRPGAAGFTVSGAGSDTIGNGWALTNEREAFLSAGPEQVGNVSFFDFSVQSGGATTALEIGFRVTIGTAYEMELRASTTQIRIRDTVAAANIDTIAIDMTQRMQFLVDRTFLYYKRPGDLAWTRVLISLNPGTPGGGRSSEITFGEFVAGTSSTWYAAGVSRVGRQTSITGQFLRGPVSPCYLPPSVGVPSILTLTDGPGLPGDQATIDPLADYSIEYLDPARYPSPDTRWRSTQDATSEDVVWDLGIETQVGRSVALVVAGGSFRLARASYWDGAAWMNAGTIDLATGFTSLSYEIAGDILEPDSGGTAAAARYIAENELVGGHVVIAGTPNTKHRILANGPGLWADGSDVVPWIRVDDAAAIPATGTVNIVCPGGVMVASPAATVSARYWRLRFVGGQGGPGDVFEAGTAWIGRLLPMGAVPDWTWTDTSEPNVSRRMDSYGTARARELGPVRRSWTWSWADGGADLFPLRDADAANLDAVKVPGGRGIVAGEDVWMSLRGALQTHQALPVAALRKVPADGITITDPTLWLYGYLDGSVSARGVVGTEGEDEVVRVESITIRENV